MELQDAGKLGFGCMRLPKRGLVTDIKETERMVDAFLEAGFHYFDTAYVYPGSEEAVRKALVKRHPRESFVLATKLNAIMMARNEKAAKKQFYTSLERTGAGYFDYYLLHALMEGSYAKYDKYHLWEFVRELKEQGLVKHLGFSFHAGPKLLDRVLTAHPEVDFVQLQINYADWEDQHVQARANWEVARAHGVPIVVMEPVKGGKLANPPKKVRQLFDAANPGASYASWALRFAASLEGVAVVLSGMSSMDQMRDNLSFMQDFQPLSADELAVVRAAQEEMGNAAGIPCTACGYCRGECPVQIPIPEVFSAMNLRLAGGQTERSRKEYTALANGGPLAEACVGCGACARVCPQQIDIPALMREQAAFAQGA